MRQQRRQTEQLLGETDPLPEQAFILHMFYDILISIICFIIEYNQGAFGRGGGGVPEINMLKIGHKESWPSNAYKFRLNLTLLNMLSNMLPIGI